MNSRSSDGLEQALRAAEHAVSGAQASSASPACLNVGKVENLAHQLKKTLHPYSHALHAPHSSTS